MVDRHSISAKSRLHVAIMGIVVGACAFAIPSGAYSQKTKADDQITKASDASLDNAFVRGMTGVDEERKTNHANQVGCTESFSDFRRLQSIEAYVEFFRSIGLRPVRVDANGRHYIKFEFSRAELSSRGYRGFRYGDRLVFVFTTVSADSSEITSFNAVVFGPTYP